MQVEFYRNGVYEKIDTILTDQAQVIKIVDPDLSIGLSWRDDQGDLITIMPIKQEKEVE